VDIVNLTLVIVVRAAYPQSTTVANSACPGAAAKTTPRGPASERHPTISPVKAVSTPETPSSCLAENLPANHGDNFEQLPTYPQRWLLRKVVQVYKAVSMRLAMHSQNNAKPLIQQTGICPTAEKGLLLANVTTLEQEDKATRNNPCATFGQRFQCFASAVTSRTPTQNFC
jgi:hypothetical protein